MKKKLTLVGFIGFGVLFGCSQVNQEVEASLPVNFKVEAEDTVGWGEVYKAKDMDTGCYYIFGVSRSNSATTVSTTQMMIEKGGVSVPYCEK